MLEKPAVLSAIAAAVMTRRAEIDRRRSEASAIAAPAESEMSFLGRVRKFLRIPVAGSSRHCRQWYLRAAICDAVARSLTAKPRVQRLDKQRLDDAHAAGVEMLTVLCEQTSGDVGGVPAGRPANNARRVST